jgi:hypothetical protein
LNYITEVISPKGIRIKGDDHSEEIARRIEQRSKSLGKNGWRLINVLPAMMSEGALYKAILIFVKEE